MENTNETQVTEQNDWIKRELEEVQKNNVHSDKEALKLEEGKLTVFEVDFSKKFEKWIEPESGTVKKILPVLSDGEFKVLWINTRNPLYAEILNAYIQKGTTLFKVMTTGSKKKTRYTIVKE